MNNEALIARVAYNLRVSSVLSTTTAGSGHPTSCLSAADIVATLFCHIMRFDPHDPHNPNNDRFILSKGHAAPLLYAIWKELGVISPEELLTLRQFGSALEGHPTPAFSRYEAATGSLGQGLSVGLGMALAAHLDKRNYRTFVLMGDGELSEGSIWEAAEIAAYYKVSSLIGIVDCNRLSQSTTALYQHSTESYAAQFKAFGWNTLLIDGHSIPALIQALETAYNQQKKPTVLLAHTYKGYGLEGIENKEGFHGTAFKKADLPEILTLLAQRFPQASASANMNTETITPRNIITERTGHEWQKTTKAQPISTDSISQGRQDGNREGKFQEDFTVKKELHYQKLGPSPYALDELIPTRKAYGDALARLGTYNSTLVSLDADVKNSTYAQTFEKIHPERFIQCFIAEQNMVGMGVGLAARGKIPFISTFGCFFSRAYDQIRMAAIGKAPLRLCGSHAGVSIGHDGPSQMALEDIALMRALPDSAVLYPSDATSCWKLMDIMAHRGEGITYLRTTRGPTPTIYARDEEFHLGGCKIVKSNSIDQVTIIGAGITLFEALKAYDILKSYGVSVAVIDLYSIKPLDIQTLRTCIEKSEKRVVVVEDHYGPGGIGEAVLQALANQGYAFKLLAVPGCPRSGSPEELMAWAGIDAAAIVAAALELVDHALSP